MEAFLLHLSSLGGRARQVDLESGQNRLPFLLINVAVIKINSYSSCK